MRRGPRFGTAFTSIRKTRAWAHQARYEHHQYEMKSYNGYSGREREAHLWAFHRLKRAGELPAPPDRCMLCGDPGAPLEAHSEDYSQPYLWTPPAMYWLCQHCHRNKLHKRFLQPTVWRAFLLHVRRGGYASDLKLPANKREFQEAIKVLASGKVPSLRPLRPRKFDGEPWWEQLTLDPARLDSPQARPRA